MRLPLRQRRLHHRRGGGQSGQAVAVGQQSGRVIANALDRIAAQMLRQPPPPVGRDPIARLQHAPQPTPHAAPHQAHVTAVLPGQQIDNGRSLAVAADGEHVTFV